MGDAQAVKLHENVLFESYERSLFGVGGNVVLKKNTEWNENEREISFEKGDFGVFGQEVEVVSLESLEYYELDHQEVLQVVRGSEVDKVWKYK